MVQATGTTCCAHGPGYASPLDAFKHGPREELLYITAVAPDKDRPDSLLTVDVKFGSPTYGQVIHRLAMPYHGDELHHSGWNSCSSCYNDPAHVRRNLILPALNSGRVYAIDTATDPHAPRLAHVLEPEAIKKATGQSYLHTSHCLGTGEIMISSMGDANTDGEGKGGLLLLDQDLKIKGTWSPEFTKYGYDYWYQPGHNVLISTSWGAPSAFSKGFDPSLVPTHYGSSLYVWDWTTHKLLQEIELGEEGLIPLEVRFKHDPKSTDGYVGAALASNLIHISKDGLKWKAGAVFKQEWTQVEGFALPALPPLITDILLSLDDKYLYLSNWLRGDIVKLDVSDPANPKVAGRVWVGGLLRKGSPIKPLSGLPDGLTEVPDLPTIKGVQLRGGPQMLQLSLDGKRLYVTNSLYSAWDRQFYPELISKGSHLLLVDVDTEKGGLTLNTDFIVDFGAEPGGPVLAHEVRYPGGDCSSDIWL